MVSTRYKDADSGIEICISIHSTSSAKKKVCWVTSSPQNLDGKFLDKIVRKYCKNYHMKLLDIRDARPYECHAWQHETMTVFEVECTSTTPRLIYEFGKI